MPPADAPGFCKETCRFQRPKSGAVNAKTKSILAFTIYTGNHDKTHKIPHHNMWFFVDFGQVNDYNCGIVSKWRRY